MSNLIVVLSKLNMISSPLAIAKGKGFVLFTSEHHVSTGVLRHHTLSLFVLSTVPASVHAHSGSGCCISVSDRIWAFLLLLGQRRLWNP